MIRFGPLCFLIWVASALFWAASPKIGAQLVFWVAYAAIVVVFSGAIVALIGTQRLRFAHGVWFKRLCVLVFVAMVAGPLTVRFIQSF